MKARKRRGLGLLESVGSPSLVKRARRRIAGERAGRRRTDDRRAKLSVDGGMSSAASRVAPGPGPRRIRLVLFVSALGGAVLLARAGQLQLMRGEAYGEVAERQARMSALIKAKRGVIQDRHGSELAITVEVDSVFAEPRRIEDRERAAALVAPILGQEKERVRARLESDRAFTYLSRRVDGAVAERVRSLGIAGIATHREPKRFYSNVELAAQVLGFTNLEGEGKAGVELSFDEDLRGASYELPGLRDALGNTVFSEGFVPHAVLEGADLRLTIDRQIQHAAEGALAETVAQSKARAGAAIVLEAGTGEVLAMASFPTFNPNNLARSGGSHHLNRGVSAVYEPGSTLKMVTIGAAIEERLVGPGDLLDCEQGKWRVGGRTISDDTHAFGKLTVSEVMKVSSNICAAKLGVALGRERLHAWLVRFGFGTVTGIELPGELKGLLRPAKEWREITLANIAFGQGIAATPLQIAQVASVIANDGLLVHPRIVRAIVEKSGEVRELDRPGPERVLSSDTARALRRMLVEVTRPGGTAPSAAVPGFEVAGKTGTAQKLDPVTRTYSHDLHVASFVGFVPAEKPEVIILVLLDEPRSSSYGGIVAAPAFRRIAVAALAAREVFPPSSREPLEGSFEVRAPRAEAVSRQEGREGDEEEESWPEADGMAVDFALSREAQALLGLGESPGAGGAGSGAPPLMPNFRGLTLHEVLDRSSLIHCDPVIIGSGRVIAQDPAPGVSVEPGSRCEIELAPGAQGPRRGRSGA